MTQDVTQTAAAPNLYGTPVPSRRRAVVVPQAGGRTVRCQILDARGNPTDLSPYTGPAFTAACAVRESLSPDQTGAVFQVASIESPPATDFIDADVPASAANAPGLYVMEFVITDDTLYPRAATAGEVVLTSGPQGDGYAITTQPAAGGPTTYTYPAGVQPVVGIGQTLLLKQQLVRDCVVVLSYTCYLLIERGVHGTSPGSYGPPTLAEIRLHLRDQPEANLLLDDFEFDDGEIALAITRPVEYFNETPPPLTRRFDTTNFPSRWYWLEGVCWTLFSVAANWHRRNRLPYTAGGVSVDDTGKEREYAAAAELYGTRFRDWVRLTKVRMNMEAGFATMPSDYSGRWQY